MPAESKYPPIDIPNVGIYDFLFGDRKRDFGDDQGSSSLQLNVVLMFVKLRNVKQKSMSTHILQDHTHMLKSNRPLSNLVED